MFEKSTFRTRILVVFILLILISVIVTGVVVSFLSAGQAYPNLAITAVIAAAVGLLASLAALIAIRRIMQPLDTLARIAGQISAGNLEIEADTEQGGEPGAIARALNSLSAQLRAFTGALDLRVTERTTALERRSAQLQTAAEVARDLTDLRDLNQLLNRAVNLICERFGLYHVGIFLVDEQGEWAILRSATGEAGKALLEQEYRLKVGEAGLIGLVTGTGQPRIALGVGADAMPFENSWLPAARSQMALPFKVAGKIIGALDVQSTSEAAFSEEDIQILQTLADQLAIAIENARLFQEMGQALNQLEMAQGRVTQDAWRIFTRRTGHLVGYQNRGLGIEPSDTLNPEAYQALYENRPIVLAHTDAVGNASRPMAALAVPIRLRGQVFGVLNVRFKDQPVTPEVVSTFEEIATRLSLVLENTRLLYEAQRLAEREQQINLISTQVRSSVNIDTILQNTVRELGRVLGTSRAFIQLGIQKPEDKENGRRAGETRENEGREG